MVLQIWTLEEKRFGSVVLVVLDCELEGKVEFWFRSILHAYIPVFQFVR